MKLMNFELKPHSLYLLLMACGVYFSIFIGLPFFIDDKLTKRPKTIMLFEVLLITFVVYHMIFTAFAFISFVMNRNISLLIHQRYLRHLKYSSIFVIGFHVCFYLSAVFSLTKFKKSSLKFMIIRFLIILTMFAFIFIKSSELASVDVKELEVLCEDDEDSMSMESEKEDKKNSKTKKSKDIPISDKEETRKEDIQVSIA